MNKKTLKDLAVGEKAIIADLMAEGSLRERFHAMGIRHGMMVIILHKTLWGGVLHIRVGSNTELILRSAEAKLISI